MNGFCDPTLVGGLLPSAAPRTFCCHRCANLISAVRKEYFQVYQEKIICYIKLVNSSLVRLFLFWLGWLLCPNSSCKLFGLKIYRLGVHAGSSGGVAGQQPSWQTKTGAAAQVWYANCKLVAFVHQGAFVAIVVVNTHAATTLLCVFLRVLLGLWLLICVGKGCSLAATN